MIKKEDLEEESNQLADEKSASLYGYNPNDIMCRLCAYKSCMQESKGREIIKRALNKKSEKDKI